MAGTDGFTTDTHQIRQHADYLGGELHDGLSQVVEASQVSIGVESLGVLCQAWSFIFSEEHEEAKRLVAKLPELMTMDAECLRQVAQVYEETEDINLAVFGKGQ